MLNLGTILSALFSLLCELNIKLTNNSLLLSDYLSKHSLLL